MKQNTKGLVNDFMMQFASNTGLYPESSNPKRYLWTDAFAVCNFLELYITTKEKKYLDLTLKLIDQVHNVLGKYRPENNKEGWISGLEIDEGKNHPTLGGLRIGKEINEREPNEQFNERLEWDRDGQYYHYLTKWMHALNNTSMITGDIKYIQWALELAKTAHAHFTYLPKSGTIKRMYWKMSIDLKYPQVPSMGQHDPLDGYITYNEIQNGINYLNTSDSIEEPLKYEIEDMKTICSGMAMVTDDPLGLGGLLSDATRVAQLITQGCNQFKLLETILNSTLVGLRSYNSNNPINIPRDYRLAFRELGLSIGFKGLVIIKQIIKDNSKFFSRNSLKNQLNELNKYNGLIDNIEDFWLEETNRNAKNWIEHRDINTVMLATTLAPEGFLKINL
jgi:hypothetical protein